MPIRKLRDVDALRERWEATNFEAFQGAAPEIWPTALTVIVTANLLQSFSRAATRGVESQEQPRTPEHNRIDTHLETPGRSRAVHTCLQL